MRARAVAAACCVAMCLGAPMAARANQVEARESEPQCFTWDLNDWERTHLSGGTGGTEPREPGQIYPFWGEWWGYEEDLPVNAEVRALVTAWKAEAERMLGTKMPGEFELASAGLLNARCGIFTWSEDEEDGCEHIQTAVFDIEKKRALALSDFFYDGFNYIDYINSAIAAMPEDTLVNSYTETQPPSTDIARRVFSGLPRDYPYFSIHFMHWGPAYLRMQIDDHIPFWINSTYPIGVFVPLTHWVSPWGTCKVDTLYREQTLSNGLPFFAPLLRVDDGREPEAEAAINRALAEMTERQKPYAEQLPRDECLRVQPDMWHAGRWACVRLDLMRLELDVEYSERLLEAAIFDLHTGAKIALEELFAKAQRSDEVKCYRYADGGRPFALLPGYVPDALPEIADIRPRLEEEHSIELWFLRGEDTVIMRIPLRLLDDMVST